MNYVTALHQKRLHVYTLIDIIINHLILLIIVLSTEYSISAFRLEKIFFLKRAVSQLFKEQSKQKREDS